MTNRRKYIVRYKSSWEDEWTTDIETNDLDNAIYQSNSNFDVDHYTQVYDTQTREVVYDPDESKE